MWQPSEGQWFDVLGSTNDWLKSHHSSVGDWVQAGCQTGGRGRGSNTWHSPEGNLYLSIVIPQRQVLLLQSLAVGIAMTQFCLEQNIPARVKWPNDVCVGKNKIGGILCEIINQRIIAGIGLNLSSDNLPVGAIAADSWSSIDPRHCGQSLVQDLPRWTDPLVPVSSIQEQWLELWHGESREFNWGEGSCVGQIKGLDIEKNQVELVSNGKIIRVASSLLKESWPDFS